MTHDTEFYGDLADTVTELLSEFGDVAAIVRHATDSAYDPATGETSTGTVSTDTACVAAVFDYPDKLIDGSLIQVGDRQALVNVTGLDPLVTDKFSWQGDLYSIVNVKQLAPAGVDVMYELQVRR